jgi:CHAT domain-containing protein
MQRARLGGLGGFLSGGVLALALAATPVVASPPAPRPDAAAAAAEGRLLLVEADGALAAGQHAPALGGRLAMAVKALEESGAAATRDGAALTAALKQRRDRLLVLTQACVLLAPETLRDGLVHLSAAQAIERARAVLRRSAEVSRWQVCDGEIPPVEFARTILIGLDAPAPSRAQLAAESERTQGLCAAVKVLFGTTATPKGVPEILAHARKTIDALRENQDRHANDRTDRRQDIAAAAAAADERAQIQKELAALAGCHVCQTAEGTQDQKELSELLNLSMRSAGLNLPATIPGTQITVAGCQPFDYRCWQTSMVQAGQRAEVAEREEKAASCLDREGDGDGALEKRDQALKSRRLHEPPGSTALLKEECKVAAEIAKRPGGNDGAARRIEAAISTFKAGHPYDLGAVAAFSLPEAYEQLALIYLRAGEREAAERAAASHRQYLFIDPKNTAFASLLASRNTPLGASTSVSDAAWAQAELDGRLAAGDRAALKRELEQKKAIDARELAILSMLQMSAGEIDAALASMEGVAYAAESSFDRLQDLLPHNRAAGGQAGLWAGTSLLSQLAEERLIWTAAKPGTTPDLARALGFFVSEHRKGRFFDAMTPGAREGGDPDGTLETLRLARASRAARFLRLLVEGSPQPSPCADPLLDQIHQLERKLMSADMAASFKSAAAARSVAATVNPPIGARPIAPADYPRGLAQTFLRELIAHLPPGARFVGYVRFQRWRDGDDLRRPLADSAAEARYVGYVVGPLGLRAYDLGEAPPIDELVARAIRPPAGDSPPGAAVDAETLRTWQDLYDRIWRPLAAGLEKASHVYIAADGALQSLPFAALHDGVGWLYERREISQVHSARDLLTDGGARRGAGGPPLIIASPTAPLLGRVTFPPLAGAGEEASAVQALLPGSTLLSGDRADERSLLAVQAPRILHVASHAIYLSDAQLASAGGRPLEGAGDSAGGVAGGAPERGLRLVLASFELENAARQWRGFEEGFMRSALVLSVPPPGDRDGQPWDGFASAYEIVTMNLRGTELVTLSACDTGTGAQVSFAHDVGSLQQAFLVAGAQSVVASLWKVNDQSTALWMKTFYRVLGEGGSRSAAMRSAMTTVSRSYPNPVYWAAFALYGDAGPLRTPAPARPRPPER